MKPPYPLPETPEKKFINWIAPHFQHLYYQQQNHGLPCFHMQNNPHHGRAYPDLLGLTMSGKWVCIEYEPGNKYHEIVEGTKQLITIINNVNTGTTFTTDDGHVDIKPDYYTLATNHSINGHVWGEERIGIQYYSRTGWMSTHHHCTRWAWALANTQRIGIIIALYSNIPTITVEGGRNAQLNEL